MDFSVVIATYRRHEFVVQAVDSALAQHHPPAEVIVVSDGPDPELRARLGRHPVRVLDPAHRGVAAARNTGVRAATSRWVSFLDDDDLWHPEHLALTAEYLARNPHVRAVNAPIWTFSARADFVGAELIASDLESCLAAAKARVPTNDQSFLDIAGHSFDALLERNRCCVVTSTVDRELLLEAGGFPEGYTCAEDWVMSINVARYAEWHTLSERTCFVRGHESNNTSVTRGLVALQAIARVWESPSRQPPHRPLKAYGLHYRFMLQSTIWSAMLNRRPDIALAAFKTAMPLLPVRRDRWYALVPPPLIWRIQRARRFARAQIRRLSNRRCL